MQRPVVSYEEHATFCIHQNEENSACGSSASAKTSSFRFAELPQAPKRSLFDLRNFRKRQNVLFLICGSPANAKTFFFDLRNFRKHFQKHFGHRVAPVETLGGLYSYYRTHA